MNEGLSNKYGVKRVRNCVKDVSIFFSFFLGDNYGRQTGKYDAKNARLANKVPGSRGA